MRVEREDGLKCRLVSDLPFAGECKVRVKSDGTSEGTSVFAVDSEGRELRMGGVMAIRWKLTAGDEMATIELRVDGDVEADLKGMLEEETPK